MIYAKKSLGQNFLSDPKILGKIADAAGLTKADTVLEVGPGTGNLTKLLAERAGKVIAVEKDHRLIEQLQSQFPDRGRIQIIEGDVLELPVEFFDTWKLVYDTYSIVGNIPYYITSHFIRTIFEQWPLPRIIVLTVQKEVAQRIVATPPHMNLLALSVQFYADAEIVGTIKRGSFRPAPKVDSAIVRMVPKKELPNIDPKKFFAFLKEGFSAPRKQLANTLRRYPKGVFRGTGINPTQRPSELTLQQWFILTRKGI